MNHKLSVLKYVSVNSSVASFIVSAISFTFLFMESFLINDMSLLQWRSLDILSHLFLQVAVFGHLFITWSQFIVSVHFHNFLFECLLNKQSNFSLIAFMLRYSISPGFSFGFLLPLTFWWFHWLFMSILKIL